jgi:hypothetical protein
MAYLRHHQAIVEEVAGARSPEEISRLEDNWGGEHWARCILMNFLAKYAPRERMREAGQRVLMLLPMDDRETRDRWKRKR